MKCTAMSQTRIIELLDEVHLSEVERWKARDYAALGEVVADLIIAAARGVRSLAHAIERTSRLPARAAH
jgi:hypothetical protein